MGRLEDALVGSGQVDEHRDRGVEARGELRFEVRLWRVHVHCMGTHRLHVCIALHCMGTALHMHSTACMGIALHVHSTATA